MKLYVQDIYNFPELSKMTLIAGEGGLKKEVKHCGILDYEYDQDVANKYSDYNYRTGGGFITLTTFLYAKHDPNLIYEAVKKLAAKNGSGLIIKNIFKLPIAQNVIKYADYMDFPVFVLHDSYPFFEDIILLINKKMEQYESFYFMEQRVNTLLKADASDTNLLTALTYEINPSLQDDLAVAFFRPKEGRLSRERAIEEENKLYKAGLIEPGDAIFFYGGGLMLIHSAYHCGSGHPVNLFASYAEALGPELFQRYDVGVSDLHHVKDELAEAIREALYAVSFDERSVGIKAFDQLGVYQAILPFAESKAMDHYSRRYISPIKEYDAGRSGEILNTVIAFVKAGGNLDTTAEQMGQHKNTIRYRLNTAGNLLNLNLFSLGDFEKMALAVRIDICSDQSEIMI
ncbi:MAG: PucR family transcriptional regulator ligand-binding domain-containing protein [Eubacteriales bacterium]|nr:PucR family transcriptional regulator ligand-binding domain-containing protein [Eubacteriales bacterium]MDD3863925.1 PucR family transcriptional regulator ligand-binding domain-containing protein [Eubacteriales bacterium]MDD4445647.1 PucR family transcriptional regulator ligand-binding domain-containing protein [Eubacteriales bacterium]